MTPSSPSSSSSASSAPTASSPNSSREELAFSYLDSLRYPPYPLQEEAILAWFEENNGIMVCAPTGTGKTLIAEAALFEALHTGHTVYYTTPLIALTEQKFAELQDSAERWGFQRDQVGLVTGNRRVNPQANVLVVVAEILLNRLLSAHCADATRHSEVTSETQQDAPKPKHSTPEATTVPNPASPPSVEQRLDKEHDQIGWDVDDSESSSTAAPLVHTSPDPTSALVHIDELPHEVALSAIELDFNRVSAVVMDEFHSFSDPERGIVWEFSLALLPDHVRLLLLSATIGNAVAFVNWCQRLHGRSLRLIQGTERRVPLRFQWVGDSLLTDHLESMADGDEAQRRTPALVFCFNRDECWNVAEELKGKSMLADGQQKRLVAELDKLDWSKGVGPKLKQLLQRGVGVHHAGVLPRYKRVVESLFQKKLLTICVCTETLAAGINLPARSVVLPSLMKGKPGEQKLIDPSSAHQIFGRAGRPQFDTEGFVHVLAHEDDVRILRWREQYDQIPEDTKDPLLIRAKKALKKKMPTRSPDRQYWNEQQFDKLRAAPPGDLVSRGPLPWRLLAYLLHVSPDVDLLRKLVHKRLMDPKQLDAGEKQLERMLLTLHAGDYVRLDPPPPPPPDKAKPGESAPAEPEAPKISWLSQQLQAAVDKKHEERTGEKTVKPPEDPHAGRYRPKSAHPTERLPLLFSFRSVNPLYGMFLVEHLGHGDKFERLLVLESVLELPNSLLRSVRVPPPHKLPPGPLALEHVDIELVQRGLIAASDLYPEFDPDCAPEDRKYAPSLAEKMRMLFESEHPEVRDINVQGAFVAADLLSNFGDNFWLFVSAKNLAKQEGLVFRHLLRLVLLLDEFEPFVPPGLDPNDWADELRELRERITASCRAVDPTCTDSMLTHDDEVDYFEFAPKR